VGQVAARDDELGAQIPDEAADLPFKCWIIKPISRAEVQVGHVQDACSQGRSRLQ